jgi:HSP20 family protein
MSSLMRRDRGGDVASRFNRMDRIFDEWMRSLPMRRPFGLAWDWQGDDLIRVDEYRDGDTEVIRAELPGIDQTEDKGYLRHELRVGSMARTLPLPEGVTESDITATYKDGILEIRIPVPERAQTEPTKIEIKKG